MIPAAAAFGKLLFSTLHFHLRAWLRARPVMTRRSRSLTENLNRLRSQPEIEMRHHSYSRVTRAGSSGMDEPIVYGPQALGPFENPKEFNSSRLFVAHNIYDRYKPLTKTIFGVMPMLADMARFPAAGKPETSNWEMMTANDQKIVTQVYVNIGKSIAAYERTLRVKPNALDQYIGGDTNALTVEQKKGLRSFFTLGCAECHYGPRLTDDAFHIVRFPTGRQDGVADRGRSDGIVQLLANEFLGTGEFSDAPSAENRSLI